MEVIVFYAFAFGLNILVFSNFICRKEYQSGLNFFICIALLIRSYGQLMIAGSQSVDMARFANETFYFGSAFLPAFLFLAAARLGRVKVPVFIEVTGIVYSVVIMFLAVSIGRSDVYYKDFYIVKHPEGYTTIGKVYGPLHILYPIMLALYAVGFVWLFLRAYRNRNRISKRVIAWASFLAVTVIVLYALDKIVKSPISLTSVAYVIASVICIRIMGDAEMHDLNGCILESMNGNEEKGVIVFDNGAKYINANDKAKEIYPEIERLPVGKPVDKECGKFYDHVVTRVQELNVGLYDPEDSRVVEVGDKKYEIDLNEITLLKGESRVGTFVQIEDVTTRENISEMEDRYGKELEEDVKKKEKEIADMQNRLVLGLATLVESRDSSTGGHIVRTQKGVRIFAERLKEVSDPRLSDEFLNRVILATPMHDLGKIAIDDDILKAAKKTKEQEEVITKLHTEEGAKIVRKVLAGIGSTDDANRFVEIAVNIAAYHHELWDGSGLPFGLRGKEIPVEARIVAFVDRLDNCLEDEENEDFISFDTAFDRVVNDIGTKFDPELGAVFVKCRKEMKEIYMGLENL